jgi:hypothetical protein
MSCAPTDLLRDVRVGWPRCCGEVTAFVGSPPAEGPPDRDDG